jgi:hypothetical protein
MTLKRYSVHNSWNGVDWIKTHLRYFRFRKAVTMANRLAADLPGCHVEVLDAWRHNKMVHYVRPDLNFVHKSP